MFNSGIFAYWQRNEFFKIENSKSSKKKKEKDQIGSSSSFYDELIKPLTNVQLQSSYYFFLVGIGISFLSILIEISLPNVTL